MGIIELPATLYENDYPTLLNKLATGDSVNEVRLDISKTRFYTPASLVAILAKIHWWVSKGKTVFIENIDQCSASEYLKRIDFFSHTGIELPETFKRHDPSGRFMELRRIGGAGSVAVEDVSTEVANCIFPESLDDPTVSDLFDLLQFSISELANNVIQHSRAHGFIMAQYTEKTDRIRIGIADRGIGVLSSFSQNGSPLWNEDLNDIDAIKLAVRPKTSSKLHLTSPWGDPVNAGVGLTILKEFCALTGGHFALASGVGYCVQSPTQKELQSFDLQGAFNGTLCALSFSRRRVRSFADLLQRAKESVGLLQTGESFDKYFT